MLGDQRDAGVADGFRLEGGPRHAPGDVAPAVEDLARNDADIGA
jgi:hypothetical protein